MCKIPKVVLFLSCANNRKKFIKLQRKKLQNKIMGEETSGNQVKFCIYKVRFSLLVSMRES